MIKKLNQVKEWVQLFNNLEKNKTNHNTDMKMTESFEKFRDLLTFPKFWHILFGDIITQLKVDSIFEVIANWMQYCIVREINVSNFIALPVNDLKTYLDLISVVFERRAIELETKINRSKIYILIKDPPPQRFW